MIAQFPQSGQAVLFWHPNIEHDCVGMLRAGDRALPLRRSEADNTWKPAGTEPYRKCNDLPRWPSSTTSTVGGGLDVDTVQVVQFDERLGNVFSLIGDRPRPSKR